MKKVKVKKPIYQRWWFIVFAALFVMGGIASLFEDDTAADTEPKTEQAAKEEPVVEEEPEPVVEEEPAEKEPVVEEEAKEEKPVVEEEAAELDTSDSSVDETVLAELAESILIDSFGEIADIYYDESEHIYNITPTDEDFILEIYYITEGMLDSSDWDVLVESMIEISESINENVGDGYTISLLNPANTENTLLLVMDGVVLYNFIDG